MPPIPQPQPALDLIRAHGAPWSVPADACAAVPRDSSRDVDSGVRAVADWMAIAALIGREVELDTSAHDLGAVRRRRGVTSARDLLCLALMHGPGRMPLRQITHLARHAGLGRFGEPALFRRLAGAQTWLMSVAGALLGRRLSACDEDAAQTAAEPDVAAGLDFLVAFTPWPADRFTEAQMRLLLGVRWTYISAMLRRTRVAVPDRGCTVLGPAREASLLICAIVLPDL